MTGYGQAASQLAAEYAAEDGVLRTARARARQAGVGAVDPAGGDALRMLVAAVGARAVAEIGTGAGVSGVCLLRGMRRDGLLTTVDPEPSRQALAREAFADAGFAAGQTRLITGRALDVLPRLADGGYDVVFCDGDRAEWPEYLAESLRLLRSGGLLCFAGAVAGGDGGGEADVRRERARVAGVRDAMAAVRDADGLVPALLPVAGGLLCAVRR